MYVKVTVIRFSSPNISLILHGSFHWGFFSNTTWEQNTWQVSKIIRPVKQKLIVYTVTVMKCLQMTCWTLNDGWSITVIFLRYRRRILYLITHIQQCERADVKGLVWTTWNPFKSHLFVYDISILGVNITKFTSHAFGQSRESCRTVQHIGQEEYIRYYSWGQALFTSASFFFCTLEPPGLSIWSWRPFRKRRIFSMLASWYSWDHLCQDKATGVWW